MYVWLACSRNDNQQKQFMDGCLGRNARCFLQKLDGQRHAAALKTPLAWCWSKWWLRVVAGVMQDGGFPCRLVWRR